MSTGVVKWAGISALILLLSSFPGGQGSPYNEDDTFKSYAGYSLLRTSPVESPEQTEQLLQFDGQHGIHFWRYPFFNNSADILTSPNRIGEIQSLLRSLGLSHSTIISDVNDLLESEKPNEINNDEITESQAAHVKAAVHNSFFQQYQRFDSIMNFARQLAASDPRVTFSTIGGTSEGRQIGLVKISSSGSGSKPAIWIDGGMHAREWISPATATYIMYKLVKDQNAQSLIDMFDFYIVPVVNADGYEYTHTRDRLWRKTRSRQNGNCIGVDPNRNWGFHWAESGSSRDPCSDIYHGPRAFSEPETANVANTILGLRSQLKLYLTFHAYSQMWLVPWGYSRYQKPSDYNELMRMGGHGKRALEGTYGTRYQIGTAPDLLYAAAGGSDDWAKGSAGVKYAYCLELRPSGQNPGFLLPPSQIVPTGEETYNGVVAMAKELYTTLKRQNGGGKPSRPYASSPFNNTEEVLVY